MRPPKRTAVTTATALAALVATVTWSCNGVNPGDRLDAGPESGLEASIPDVVVPDVTVPDARVDSAWCGQNPFPGVDPNALELIPVPPTPMCLSFSRDGSYVAYSRADPDQPGPWWDYEVYLFDLDTRQEVQITYQPDSWQGLPAVHGEHIVHNDGRFMETPGDDSGIELMLYDIANSQETRLTNSPDGKSFPQMNDDYVVYKFYLVDSGAGALRLLERSTGISAELSPSDRAAEGFSISERYVTWVAIAPGVPVWNKDVHIHDLQTGETLRLETTAESLAYETSVSGSRVVWMDDRNGNWDIYMYDIEAGQELRLTDDPLDQIGPRIHGNLVTFADYRFSGGWWDNYQCAYDIYILDVDTMIGRRVTNWPWYWGGIPGDDGLVVAILRDQNTLDAPSKLYVFDLIEMGILDATGHHVLPEP